MAMPIRSGNDCVTASFGLGATGVRLAAILLLFATGCMEAT